MKAASTALVGGGQLSARHKVVSSTTRATAEVTGDLVAPAASRCGGSGLIPGAVGSIPIHFRQSCNA